MTYDFAARAAPSEEAQRLAAWILVQAAGQGDQISTVLWLAAQLERIDRGALIRTTSGDEKMASG